MKFLVVVIYSVLFVACAQEKKESNDNERNLKLTNKQNQYQSKVIYHLKVQLDIARISLSTFDEDSFSDSFTCFQFGIAESNSTLLDKQLEVFFFDQSSWSEETVLELSKDQIAKLSQIRSFLGQSSTGVTNAVVRGDFEENTCNYKHNNTSLSARIDGLRNSYSELGLLLGEFQ